MKNLKQLCLFLSVGGVAALSIGACGDDTPAPGGTAGTGTAGTGTAGTGTAGTGTAGTGTAGTGTAGTGTAGTGTAGTGTAGTASGGGGAGGASGGNGSGGKAGGGGMGGASGGASGGSAGSGGSGGGASAGCMKLCMGADSIGTICAGETMSDTIKNMCLASCAKATEQQVTCWNEHVANAKNTPAMKAMHCGHAAGAAPCSGWPTP